MQLLHHLSHTKQRCDPVCSELSDLIKTNILEDHGHLIMLGDFNIHMDKPEHPDTVTFNDILESFDLVNYTTFPTHLSRQYP